MLPNFKLVPDYTRLEINGQSWLFVGGAVSINRIDREEGKTWWPNEDMVLREDLAIPSDVLVTHAGPSLANPTTNAMVRCYARFEEGMGHTVQRQLKIPLATIRIAHQRQLKLPTDDN